jgi:hypothetical protein
MLAAMPRAAWIVILSAACDRGAVRNEPAATRTEPTPPVKPVVATIDAATPAPAVGAPPPAPIAIPADLTAAPAWIGRQFRTGLIVREHTVETMTLQRAGTTALLTVDVQRAPSQMLDIGPWGPKTTKQYLGDVIESASGAVGIKVANVTDPDDVIDLPCKRGKLAVAPAQAIRLMSHRGEECGDEGRWSKPTQRIDAILCTPLKDGPTDHDDESTWPSAPHVAFAPASGIEWLYVNDDCFQGGGWRRIPADGSIVDKVRRESR